MRGLSARGRAEARIPGVEQHAKLVAQAGEFEKTLFGLFELHRRQRTHLPTRRRALLALLHNDGQFGERETEGQGAPNEEHPGQSGFRIDAIVVVGSAGPREYADPFVVPQRIGADARQFREFSGGPIHGERIMEGGTGSRVKKNSWNSLARSSLWRLGKLPHDAGDGLLRLDVVLPDR